MKKEEQLFQLIKNLSPAEKKFIKQDFNKFRATDANKSILLFDTLNKMPSYEHDLTALAYAKQGYTNRFLSADRLTLYDQLLGSLNEYHRKSTIAIEVGSAYHAAVMLSEKKLFDQSLKQINRVTKTAKRFEMFGMLIQLLHLKQRVLKILNRIDEALDCLKEEELAWEAHREVNMYIRLHYQSIKLRLSLSKIRDQKGEEQLQMFMKDPLLANPTSSYFQSNFHYLEVLCNYHFMMNQQEEELACNIRLGELIKQYDWFDMDNPLTYLAIQTRIFAINRSLDPENFWQHLENYRSLVNTFKKQKLQASAFIFIFSSNYELDYYLEHKLYKAGRAVVELMLKGIQKQRELISDIFVVTAYYRIACIYFFNNEFELCLDTLDRYHEELSPDLRPDVYSYSLIVKALAHLELGNVRLIESLVKSVRYHLKKRGHLFLTEEQTIRALKKLAKTSNVEAQNKILSSLYQKVIEIQSNNKKEMLSLDYFNIVHWLRCKMQ